MFSLEDQIHLDSEWLFTVVFEIWELKLWQMQNNILSAGSQRQAHFLIHPRFFSLVFFLSPKRLFPSCHCTPRGAHLHTMQPYCGSVRRGAILFCSVPGRQANHQWWLSEVLEVGIRPSLSARSVPLIRRLASAMQWAHWESFLTVAEWRLPPLFRCNRTKQTNMQSDTKKRANGLCLKRSLVGKGGKKWIWIGF